MNQTLTYKPDRRDFLITVIVSLGALLVYTNTLTPSLSYLSPDGSEMATVPYVLGLAHSPGYPLYTWLGFLFSHLLPWGDIAHRVNLMSAIMGAISVGGLYLIATQILPERSTGSHAIAALVALLFAFSVDHWMQSLIAEVYAPNIALVALTLLALLAWERNQRRRDFFIFALTFGLSLGTHISNLGFAPAFALFISLTILAPEKKISDIKARFNELINTILVGGFGFFLGMMQYLWLPLRSGTLNDRSMLRRAPTSLQGLFNYTLGAFPDFKFAFPITALPDRLVVYLDLLRQQFGLIGILIGIGGLFYLLFKRPRHFFLLVGMYLVTVWFFIQYRAFDLEVFFIPAHFLWALFISFGLLMIYQLIREVVGRWVSFQKTPTFLRSILWVLGIILISLIPLQNNWDHNDLSQDTAINDFYANIWEILPVNSTLLTPGGVFGYDAFYWQLVYDTRPDVFLPTLPTPDPKPEDLYGDNIYATTRAMQDNRGPGALPPSFFQEDLWEIPVLFGEQPNVQTGKRSSLVLYHLSKKPPQLVEIDPQPQFQIQAEFGSATLIGVDFNSHQIENGARIQLTLYWRLHPGSQLRVETKLGDLPLEQHEIGFGLIPRYAQEVGIPKNATIVEDYNLVIPSTTQQGVWPLTISIVNFRAEQQHTTLIAYLTIVDEMETMERWQLIAGSSPLE